MVVPCHKRVTRREVDHPTPQVGSRYAVLSTLAEPAPQGMTSPPRGPQPVGPPQWRKKEKEPKTPNKVETPSKPRDTSPLRTNPDSLFQSQAYKTTTIATHLDQNHNTAIVIEDPRLPQGKRPALVGSSSGPPQHVLEAHKPPDPPSNRGFILSSGLHIRNLAPNGHVGPASSNLRAMKALARETQPAMTEADINMLVEGVDFNSSPSSSD